MTRGVLFQDKQSNFTGFRMKGHAGYAEAGEDIVCAAISILTNTCINALESVCGIVPEAACDNDGFLQAHLPDQLTEGQMHDAQILMRALWQGLSDLAECYPEHFKLTIQ